jgi:hypothetical protein
MRLSKDDIAKWLDLYFRDVDQNQGNIETVSNLARYFTPDLEFVMHTAPASSTTTPKNRDTLLMSFVHPGLHEQLIPHYYVIDLEQMIVVVQFEIRFSDEPTGQTWSPVQASAHYHLKVDEDKELKIQKIEYWTGPLPDGIMQYWALRRQEALSAYVMKRITGS